MREMKTYFQAQELVTRTFHQPLGQVDLVAQAVIRESLPVLDIYLFLWICFAIALYLLLLDWKDTFKITLKSCQTVRFDD